MHSISYLEKTSSHLPPHSSVVKSELPHENIRQEATDLSVSFTASHNAIKSQKRSGESLSTKSKNLSPSYKPGDILQPEPPSFTLQSSSGRVIHTTEDEFNEFMLHKSQATSKRQRTHNFTILTSPNYIAPTVEPPNHQKSEYISEDIWQPPQRKTNLLKNGNYQRSIIIEEAATPWLSYYNMLSPRFQKLSSHNRLYALMGHYKDFLTILVKLFSFATGTHLLQDHELIHTTFHFSPSMKSCVINIRVWCYNMKLALFNKLSDPTLQLSFHRILELLSPLETPEFLTPRQLIKACKALLVISTGTQIEWIFIDQHSAEMVESLYQEKHEPDIYFVRRFFASSPFIFSSLGLDDSVQKELIENIIYTPLFLHRNKTGLLLLKTWMKSSTTTPLQLVWILLYYLATPTSYVNFKILYTTLEEYTVLLPPHQLRSFSRAVNELEPDFFAKVVDIRELLDMYRLPMIDLICKYYRTALPLLESRTKILGMNAAEVDNLKTRVAEFKPYNHTNEAFDVVIPRNTQEKADKKDERHDRPSSSYIPLVVVKKGDFDKARGYESRNVLVELESSSIDTPPDLEARSRWGLHRVPGTLSKKQ